MWLALAAPASFFSFESASHLALASVSHFFMWLLSAAPASFLSAESLLQVANAVVAASESTAARMMVFMSVTPDCAVAKNQDRSWQAQRSYDGLWSKSGGFSRRRPYQPSRYARKSSRAATAAAQGFCGCSGTARAPAAPRARRA